MAHGIELKPDKGFHGNPAQVFTLCKPLSIYRLDFHNLSGLQAASRGVLFLSSRILEDPSSMPPFLEDSCLSRPDIPSVYYHGF